jgi:hypothetical protein
MFWIVAGVVLGQAGLFSQVVPSPTGKNGWEEYVRAAERVVANPSAAESGRTLLERNRDLLTRHGALLDLIRQGNGKPVFDARDPMDWTRKYPEYRALRELNLAMAAAAYAEFASGKPALGTERMLQMLVMWQKMTAMGLPLAHLNGLLNSRVFFDAFDARRNQLSLEDCRRIDAVTSELLRNPVSPVPLLRMGEAEVRRALEMVVADPQTASEPHWAVGTAASKLSPEDLKRFRQAADAEARLFYEPLIRACQGTEAEWPMTIESPPPFKEGGDVEEIARGFVAELAISFRHAIVTTAQTRTQLRLLRLHARILAYRWEHGRLPGRLEDAAPEVADPLTGGRFEYVASGDEYRLWSRGRPETGEVTLRSTRAPGTERTAEPPMFSANEFRR